MTISISAMRPEIDVEQDEDQKKSRRHYEFQLGLGPFEIFELAAPRRVGIRRESYLLLHRFAGVGDVPSEIAVAEIDIHIDRELGVLGADRGGTLRQAYVGRAHLHVRRWFNLELGDTTH